MSDILDRVTEGWKEALKNKDAVRRDTLSGLRAALRTGEINARGNSVFDEAAAQAVIDKEAKRRREAIDEYTRVGREDLAAKEAAELAVIQEFLPPQLTEAELRALIESAIAQTGATSARDMGKVMGLVVPQIAGRADGKVASALVKQLLAGG